MQKNIYRIFVASMLFALTLGPMAPIARAQDSDTELRREIEQLKQGQKDINQQLQEIKKLLQAQQARPAAPAAPAGPNVKDKIFDLGANPIKGASTAKLTLVEFTDYQ